MTAAPPPPAPREELPPAVPRPRARPNAAQVVAASFLAFIAGGTALLALPVCHQGAPHAFVDDLFMATSAITLTGLATLDVGTAYSPLGLAVLALLVQVGGLGYVTLYSLALVLIGRRLSLRDRFHLREATDQPGFAGLAGYVKGVFAIMLLAEVLGFVVLATQTVPALGLGPGLGHAALYAVFAHNCAGFSPDPGGVARWAGSPAFLLTLAALSIVGGLGYNVVRALVMAAWRRQPIAPRWRPLVVLVVAMSAVLLVGTTAAIYVIEGANPRTLGGMDPTTAWLHAFFMAVQPRSSGFNTVDVGAMAAPTLVLMLPLMFVGAGPGGTGGGLKLTTLAVLAAATMAAVRGRDDVPLPFLRRSVDDDEVRRAVAALCLSATVLGAVTVVLAALEPLPFLAIAFEATSAFATVGLSMGITPALGTASKLVLVGAMYAGRVGMMMLVMAFVPRQPAPEVRYPREALLLG